MGFRIISPRRGQGLTGSFTDFSLLSIQPKENCIGFRHRYAKSQTQTRVDQAVGVDVPQIRACRSLENIQCARNTCLGEIRVGGAEHQIAVVFAGVDFHRQIVARAKGVFLANPEAKNHILSRRKTSTQGNAAGRLFGHTEHQIHLVGVARNLHGFDIHRSEKAQTVHTVARQSDFVAVIPSGFKLAELATNHFVTGAVVARYQNAPHISTARRLSLQDKLDPVVLTVNFWLGIHTGESKAKLAEVLGEGFGGFSHGLGVVGFADGNFDQGFELVILVQEVTFQLHAGHHKTFALGDVDGDGHFTLVR